uniref:ATP binding / kinase/ protein kinase/ protein serine/threonine kinase n=1 Tax=Arundo donax TaxID=35708 RepID=A0A0A9CMR7_ARUDO
MSKKQLLVQNLFLPGGKDPIEAQWVVHLRLTIKVGMVAKLLMYLV